MVLDVLITELEGVLRQIIATLPDIIAALIIILLSIWVGGITGRAADRLIERLGIEKAADRTELGKAFRAAGIDLSKFAGLLVKAFVIIVGIMVALIVLNIGGQVGNYVWFIATYVARVIGALIVLVIGSVLFELLATFIATLFSTVLPEDKRDLTDLIKDLLFVGLLAVLLSIAFNMLLLPGYIVYPLLLGVIAIAIGITLSERLVDSIADKHEDFKPIAGYAKFLILFVFLVIGIAGIFGPVAETSRVIANLAWGIAIAAALLLVPIMYTLAKKMAVERSE